MHFQWHDFNKIWENRGFVTTAGKPLQRADLVRGLLDAMMLPTNIAIVKCAGSVFRFLFCVQSLSCPCYLCRVSTLSVSLAFSVINPLFSTWLRTPPLCPCLGPALCPSLGPALRSGHRLLHPRDSGLLRPRDSGCFLLRPRTSGRLLLRPRIPGRSLLRPPRRPLIRAPRPPLSALPDAYLSALPDASLSALPSTTVMPPELCTSSPSPVSVLPPGGSSDLLRPPGRPPDLLRPPALPCGTSGDVP